MAGERLCGRCGKAYWRRQLLEVWDKRNPGHKDGWRKTRLRLCLDCQDDSTTRSLLHVAQVVITGAGTVRKLAAPLPASRRRVPSALPPARAPKLATA